MYAGDNIRTKSAQWRFKGDVVEVFDDHVAKSVPLYRQGHSLILSLSDFFVRDNSVCYDVGSSTGTLSYKLAEHHAGKSNVRFVGIEKEEDMLRKASQKYGSEHLEFVLGDVIDHEFEKSRFIVAYYVLQFIEEGARQSIVRKIHDSLESGGAFVMFEKVNAVSSNFQDMLNNAYFDFKVENGYNYEEILAKSFSIRGVLIPNTTEKNIKLLQNAGFSEISSVMKYCNFEGYLAIKS